MYRRSLYAEYAVCLGHQLPGGTITVAQKKKKNRLHLMFAAECKL